MAQSSLPPNPFVAAGMIEDSRLFVGRQDELQAMVSRMTGAQPTSINIYGEKRIGKSSLLYHFFLTWEQRVQNPNRYVVIYLSLRDVNCQTEIGFYQAVAQGLSNSVSGWQNWVNNALKRKSLNRQGFSEAIKQCEREGKLPVLCLDDFESLLKYPQEFDNGFYDNLRSLMDDNTLMLVIASRKKLDVYGSEYRFISSFFNIGHTLELKELTTDDAIQLLRLSNGSTNGVPVLSIDEQNNAQQWGKRHPYHLQLAGYYLVEARQQSKSVKWAKEQFEKQIADFKPNSKRQRWGWLRWVVWDLPVRLGSFAKFIGGTVDDVTNWIIGLVFLIMLALVFAGVLHWNEVWDFVREKLGIK
ncbi:ATP-binding protein [Sphaerospermopsis aphanizomenoides BCCUSP55]|uniref:nSTAND1 domain-containing NTPase n=1 Tax=Sphaerospermopsis aphanizomenoides TaxID=459663 RepID=UPI001903BA7D|nr:ATP-binding protein [Sphaerospermopsis aphanizomenoides]MBK1989260.1 ATP-binding protein [Sphaerospermopsis aphanizomenoides BCCUSP55]